jgi:PAS domain S-box-containing protein
MNSPVLKSRHFERRFCGHGAGQNFIFSVGLGLLAAGAIFFAPAAHAANTTNATISILVVEQGDHRPLFLDFMSRLRQVLTTNLPSHVVFYWENLDLARFEGTSYRANLEDWLRDKYRGHKMDAIVASGETSIDFVLKVRQKVWPEVPVIAIGTKGVETALLAGQTNVTGVTVDIDLPDTLKMALILFPNTRRIAFVSSAESDLPEFHGQDLKTVEDFSTNRFELIKLVGLTMAETKQRLAALPPDTIVFYDDIWKDAAGQTFIPGDALEELSSVCRAPIFSHTESYLGYGMMGGSCIIGRKLVPELAGQIAAVLRAGSANSVPVIRSESSQLVFDARQSQKFSVSESLIPPDSRLRFRTPTLWQAYHQLVIVIVAALVIQTGLIAALLLQRRRKRESEQRFRSLLDNAPDGVLVQTRERIAYVNREILQILRAERPEQLIGQPMLDLVAPEWRKIAKERMQRVNTTTDGPLPMIEEEYLRVDNSRVAVEVSAVPAVFDGDQGALVFVRDVTERKRAAETIAYERQLLRTLLDLMPYGVYIKDLDSRFLMANETLAKRFGKDNPAQLLGLSDKDFFPAETAAVFRADEEKVFAGETINEKEKSVVFPNGQKRTLLTTKVPFRNSQGKICGLVGIGLDITEHKLLEEQFRQSQKMEAFGQLAGGVAHDFNNLLTVIEGHVALLQLRESTPAEQAGGLAEISKAAERAANLTRQLLTFSRRQLFQPKPVDLNEVVANTTKMLQRLIGEHIGLETHFAPGGAPITADRNMMEQILINLAVNSRDAMPKGGRLIIQTAAITISETGAAANPKARPGAFIRLSVTDTGCGIAPKEMEHVFEPFFTTKEIGKGTGLGLATVFGIVTQHHGWIEVKTKVNEGATFHIHLPRLAETESALAELSRPSNVRGGNETILLVEDEAPVRSLARTILEQKGYHIIEADSGLSALEIWQQQRDAIDLLFTDMVMPEGISGRELAARLLAEKPGLKVIYSSGYTDDMLGESSPLRNNPNFLEKPFSPHKLLKQVRDCLDGVASSDR